MAQLSDIALVGIMGAALYLLWGMGKDLFGAGQQISAGLGSIIESGEETVGGIIQAGQEAGKSVVDVVDKTSTAISQAGYETGKAVKEYQETYPTAELLKSTPFMPTAMVYDYFQNLINSISKAKSTSPEIVTAGGTAAEFQTFQESQDLTKQFYSGEISLEELMTSLKQTQTESPPPSSEPSPTPTPTTGIAGMPGVKYITEHKVLFSTGEISKSEMERLLIESGRDPTKFKWVSTEEAYWWFDQA